MKKGIILSILGLLVMVAVSGCGINFGDNSEIVDVSIRTQYGSSGPETVSNGTVLYLKAWGNPASGPEVDLTYDVTWISQDSNIVNPLTEPGQFQAVSLGTTSVIANYNNLSGNFQVNVQ